MVGRAQTPAQKKKILERLEKVWNTGDNKYLRLGQLLTIVFEKGKFNERGEPEHLMCFFYTEDEDFIKKVEEYGSNNQK